MEAKIQQLVDFALAYKDDPDFARLTFPAEVWKRLEAHGIKPQKKEYTATQAVDKCFSIPRENQYKSNVIEVIDQTSLAIEFPKHHEKVSSTDTNETKTQPLEDSPSAQTACDVSGTTLYV